VCGTGTGGIIALDLVAGENLQELEKVYDFINEVFTSSLLN